jgi:ubiquinone/menaquinone biosynthesis C-methylase UbiE
MGRAASGYDRIGPQVFSEVASHLVGLLTIAPHERVLDVGTGPGTVLSKVARVQPSAALTGIDLSEKMIEEARARLGQDAILRVMDAEQLAFPDASFNHVTCASALYQFPHPDRAAHEFCRVTRNGGSVAISVFGATDSRWQPKDELFARYVPDLRRVGRPFDRAALRAVLEGAGYRHVAVSAREFDFQFADASEWLASAWSHGERRALEAMSEESLRGFESDLPDALEGAKEPDGLLHWRPEVVFALAIRP